MNKPSTDLDRFFELTVDLLCIAGFDGTIQRVNPAWKRTLGFDAQGVPGRLLCDFIHPQDWEDDAGRLAKLARRSRPAVFEWRCRTRDGQWRWLEWNIAPERARKIFHASARDISDRKRAEAEIQKLAAFPRMNPNPVFEFAEDGRLTYFNDAALELARALGEKHPSKILPPHTAEIVCTCLAQGRSRAGLETALCDHALSWSFHPVAASGVVHCYASDITAMKKLETQFLRAQRLESIGSLASGIAHDLNNILAPIMMSVNLLQESLTDEHDRRLLETLRLSVLRGADMTKQILTFTRGHDGERGLVNLKHLVSEIAKIARETFPRSIRIETHAARDLWPVLADATQMHQVLMNLCVNARDAMTAGGQLNVALQNVTLGEQHRSLQPEAKPGRYLRLTVTDTGIGMAPEILGRIWDPFFSLKPEGEGTGLGLSTVAGIVRSHGGFTHVESQPGEGSRFEVYLPASDVSAAIPHAGAVAPIANGRGETILVVDDERAFQEITGAIFAKYGYRVLTAGDGTEALALFAQQKDTIDLVLTDMMMPCLDGPATIRGLQLLKPGLPVIATSGLIENEPVALSLGGAFLLKPFTTEMLLDAVSRSLQSQPSPKSI